MAYDKYYDFGTVTGAGDFQHENFDLLGNSLGKVDYIDRKVGNARDGLYEDNLARIVVIPTGTAPTGTFIVTLQECDTAAGDYTDSVSRTFDASLVTKASMIGLKCVMSLPAYHKQFLKLSVKAGSDSSVAGCTFIGYVDIGPKDEYSEAVGM